MLIGHLKRLKLSRKRNIILTKNISSTCSYDIYVKQGGSLFLDTNLIGKRFGCNEIGLRDKTYSFLITTEAIPDFSGHSHMHASE